MHAWRKALPIDRGSYGNILSLSCTCRHAISHASGAYLKRRIRSRSVGCLRSRTGPVCDSSSLSITDRLRSYGVAHRELIPDTIHDTSQYANNRAELSHQPTRVRERVMRRFKSMRQAQRFLTVHAAVYNLLNLGRHLVSAKNHRFFRLRALASWNYAVA